MKKIGKFNVVDIIIILVVIAAVAVVGVKYLRPTVSTGVKSATYKVELFVEDAPNYVVNAAKIGDKIYDEAKNVTMGTVIDLEIGDGIFYAPDDQGKMVKSAKEGYNSLKVTCEATGALNDNGLTIGVTNYGVGHSFTFYVGSAKVYGRVSGIGGE